MPRTPIDYSKSVIYKIQHLEKDELVYVGSTTNFVNRKYVHKSKSNSNKYKQKVYEMIRENGGWDCFNMIIIKEYSCQTKSELLQEEDYVMRELKTSLNMVRSYLTLEEAYKSKQGDPKKRKERYEKNKEELSKKNKEKYQKNKEYILKSVKEYQEKNREQINKKRRVKKD